jgi:hypothetical protein
MQIYASMRLGQGLFYARTHTHTHACTHAHVVAKIYKIAEYKAVK